MSTLKEDTGKAVHLADILKALAHPVRLQIIAILCEGEENVNGLAERLAVKQAIVSQQLRILRMSGLVGVTRENGFSCYRLAEPRLHEPGALPGRMPDRPPRRRGPGRELSAIHSDPYHDSQRRAETMVAGVDVGQGARGAQGEGGGHPGQGEQALHDRASPGAWTSSSRR